MLDFDWNQMRTSIPVTQRVTSGQVKVASPARNTNQQSAIQLGLSEFSTPERIVVGGK